MAVVIETGFTGIAYDLTHLRIGWRRLTGTAIASSSDSGFSFENANNVRTDSAWRPTTLPGVLATWKLTFAAASDISYVGIAGHDLGTQNATLSIQTFNGIGWDTVAGSSVSPTNDDPIMWLFDTVNTAAARVVIATADDNPTIAVIAMGAVTEWPQRAVWPGTPISESDQVGFTNNLSDTGNWLGRSVTRDGQSFMVQIEHLSEAWRLGEFAAFKAYANGENAAFFIATRPGDEPGEVAYAWASGMVFATRDINHSAAAGTVQLKCMGHKPA